jgi:hypothetical protein
MLEAASAVWIRRSAPPIALPDGKRLHKVFTLVLRLVTGL